MVNAFWLDRDLDLAARWLVDRHVTSSVFECSMVLTTAARLRGYPDEVRYFTHPDHPLTRWAAEAYDNWDLLRRYTRAAHREWRYRWDHDEAERHACWAAVESLDDARIEALEWPGRPGDPPQVTGRWHADDYVDAYRRYYANDKRHLFRWSKDRTAPPWIDEYAVERSETGGEEGDGSETDEEEVDRSETDEEEVDRSETDEEEV
ncbi:MAG: hypothetical protein ABEJ28_03545, partial [Salinigranum sp.]